MEDAASYQFAQVRQKREGRHEVVYDLILRQQPKHSRMCGIGEKDTVQRADRRPVDPPPIIQLKVTDPSLPPSEQNAFLQNPYFFMYAALVILESSEELHLLRDGRTRSTTGSVVSSLYHLKDIDNADAGFFVFPDLSVRLEGTYKLKFSLFEIVGREVFHCKSICSEPFTVYSAKRFPGMEESTFLSRSFADQGLKIRIRKEIRIRRRLGKRKDSMRSEPSTSTAAKKARSKRAKNVHEEEEESGSASDSGDSQDAAPKAEIRVHTNDYKRSDHLGLSSEHTRTPTGNAQYLEDYSRHRLHAPYGPYPYYPNPSSAAPGLDPRYPPTPGQYPPAYNHAFLPEYMYDPRYSTQFGKQAGQYSHPLHSSLRQPTWAPRARSNDVASAATPFPGSSTNLNPYHRRDHPGFQQFHGLPYYPHHTDYGPDGRNNDPGSQPGPSRTAPGPSHPSSRGYHPYPAPQTPYGGGGYGGYPLRGTDPYPIPGNRSATGLAGRQDRNIDLVLPVSPVVPPAPHPFPPPPPPPHHPSLPPSSNSASERESAGKEPIRLAPLAPVSSSDAIAVKPIGDLQLDLSRRSFPPPAESHGAPFPYPFRAPYDPPPPPP